MHPTIHAWLESLKQMIALNSFELPFVMIYLSRHWKCNESARICNIRDKGWSGSDTHYLIWDSGARKGGSLRKEIPNVWRAPRLSEQVALIEQQIHRWRCRLPDLSDDNSRKRVISAVEVKETWTNSKT